MKKFTALLLTLFILLSVVACGTQATTPPKKYNTFEEIESAIDEEVSSTGTAITDKFGKLTEKIGDSYDGYKQNLDAIDEWYTYCQTEADKLYANITQLVTAYYKMVVSTIGIEDYRAWDRAMESCYDTWDDGMEDFYDSWDDSFEDAYDLFDTILSDAYDSVSYSEASDAWSDMYHKYSDSWSEMYHSYSDAWSDLYHAYTNVWGGFYHGDSDVDALIKADTDNEQSDANKKSSNVKKDESKNSESTDIQPTDSTTPDTVSPELKDTLDSYEAFIDEYIEFMDTYDESDNPLDMLSTYTDYMQKYSDMMQKMEKIDENSLSDADYQYYVEVQTRVSAKLLDTAY